MVVTALASASDSSAIIGLLSDLDWAIFSFTPKDRETQLWGEEFGSGGFTKEGDERRADCPDCNRGLNPPIPPKLARIHGFRLTGLEFHTSYAPGPIEALISGLFLLCNSLISGGERVVRIRTHKGSSIIVTP